LTAYLVSLPRAFDDTAVDRFIGSVNEHVEAPHLIIDARKNTWIDPTGVVTLFVVGTWLRDRGLPRPRLLLPESKDARACWRAMGVTRHAAACFDLSAPPDLGTARTGSSLALTRLHRDSERPELEPDLPDLTECLRQLAGRLRLKARDVIALAIGIQDVAAALLEGSGAEVWIAAQVYLWRSRLGRLVAVLALGRHGDRPLPGVDWAEGNGPPDSEEQALETLLVHGASRFRLPGGRGGELAALTRTVERLNGRLTLRARRSRASIRPAWDDAGEPVMSALPNFAGILITLIIPQPTPDHNPPGPH